MASILERPVCAIAALAGDVHVDYLNVSFPFDSALPARDALLPFVDAVGASEVTPGLFKQVIDGGTLKFFARSGVAVASASGGFLSALRSRGLYDDYLSMLSGFPHRVTMLHVTADFLHRGRDIIPEIARRGYAGEVALTRKAVRPDNGGVRWIQGLDDTGAITGTVYLGKRANADVWGRVYDKRQERLDKGYSDPGPLVRVELGVSSGMGVTLRDASAPAALFWAHAVPSLVSPDRDIAPWSGAGEGFVRGPAREFDVLTRIKQVLDTSLDVQRVVDLARKLYGVADAPGALAGLMAARCRQVGAVGVAA